MLLLLSCSIIIFLSLISIKQEQQLYYKEITEACVGSDETRRVVGTDFIKLFVPVFSRCRCKKTVIMCTNTCSLFMYYFRIIIILSKLKSFIISKYSLKVKYILFHFYNVDFYDDFFLSYIDHYLH